MPPPAEGVYAGRAPPPCLWLPTWMPLFRPRPALDFHHAASAGARRAQALGALCLRRRFFAVDLLRLARRDPAVPLPWAATLAVRPGSGADAHAGALRPQ